MKALKEMLGKVMKSKPGRFAFCFVLLLVAYGIAMLMTQATHMVLGR